MCLGLEFCWGGFGILLGVVCLALWWGWCVWVWDFVGVALGFCWGGFEILLGVRDFVGWL
ncbi:hypothetical protein NEOLEDRAFT_1143011 [Neolentinus lepideus HHB14362 ss-1]|uniref:Transmembrane protein n=1 Tax=Neolentinus lepideus HHB14362 ss-1 TaxID=1314782 RepID=A0A165MSK0_9AGAM|nr:hypothetical protein NEOLEDRAFT_1143011 [Neolentinus lepideus HHB14362 ss-1]